MWPGGIRSFVKARSSAFLGLLCDWRPRQSKLTAHTSFTWLGYVKTQILILLVRAAFSLIEREKLNCPLQPKLKRYIRNFQGWVLSIQRLEKNNECATWPWNMSGKRTVYKAKLKLNFPLNTPPNQHLYVCWKSQLTVSCNCFIIKTDNV